MSADLLIYFLIFFLFILCIVFVYTVFFVNCNKMPLVTRYEEENYFLDSSVDPPKKHRFPELKEESSVYLSVIVPAYNEEHRLPLMLNECLSYLENRQNDETDFTYEVVIVDDGSCDKTTHTALEYTKIYGSEKVRVLTLIKNRGKGGAVRLGILSSRGEYLLFADADGATKFSDIEKLEKEMKSIVYDDSNCVVIGSRAHLEKESIASRSIFRTILMYGFHFLVWLLCVRTVRDTQCGFKLFTRHSARNIFFALHVERWAFDVELLYIAETRKMIIKEVSVNWTEIEGSKLVPVWSWLQMGIDLVSIWLKYQLGIWTISDIKKSD